MPCPEPSTTYGYDYNPNMRPDSSPAAIHLDILKPQECEGGCMLNRISVSALILAAAMGVTSPSTAASRAPTPADARSFIAKAETDLENESLYVNHAAWVQATYINSDTDWLAAKMGAESTALSVRYAKEAARFDHVRVDDVTRRKLELLKHALTLPSSSRPGA